MCVCVSVSVGEVCLCEGLVELGVGGWVLVGTSSTSQKEMKWLGSPLSLSLSLHPSHPLSYNLPALIFFLDLLPLSLPSAGVSLSRHSALRALLPGAVVWQSCLRTHRDRAPPLSPLLFQIVHVCRRRPAMITFSHSIVKQKK